MKILEIGDKIEPSIYGNKAQGLTWLKNKGFNVPSGIFLPNDFDIKNVNHEKKLKTELSKLQDIQYNGQFTVAVRSSSSFEDSKDKSYAGHFKTYLGTYDFDSLLAKINQVLAGDDGNNASTGVIVQILINSKYSGIGFSSDPITANRDRINISFVEGMGDKLVSGEVDGTTLIIEKIGEKYQIPSDVEISIKDKLIQICNILKKIEKASALPVDIEWAISQDNQLFILQFRPITGIFFKDTGFTLINKKNEQSIPKSLLTNNKIKIRLLADEHGVRVSQAHLFLYNHLYNIPKVPEVINIGKTEYCSGYSTVILKPDRVNGKIQRMFADSRLVHKNFIRYCQRYGVRAVQDVQSVNVSIFRLLKLINGITWTSVIIIQEFWEASFSGIIKKLNDSYVLEVGIGQFLAKGVADTSRYTFNLNSELITSDEVFQHKEINISGGEISENTFLEPKLVHFEENQLLTILKEFKPLLDKFTWAIEFALLDNDKNETIPYLFDLVDDSSTENYSADEFNTGIISRGIFTGKVIVLINEKDHSKIIDFHYLDLTTSSAVKEHEFLVFYADMPNISLNKILKEYQSEKMAFVFNKGSLLSHFSILLRENNIPAVFLDQDIQKTNPLKNGDIVKIDALNVKIKSSDRVRKIQ